MFRKGMEKDCRAIYDLICNMEKKELPQGAFEKIYLRQLQRKDTHRFYSREGMHNFHYKFSKRLIGEDSDRNVLGR